MYIYTQIYTHTFERGKSYDKPRQHIKIRDITLPTNIHIVKAMVFPIVMYRCESWTTEKAVQFSSVQFSCSVMPNSL